MTSPARRAAIALCYAAAVSAGAYGQPAPQGGNAKPPDVGDEIQVEGRSVAALRAEIQRAEQVLYDRFNAINSRDEFDISCEYEVQTGSKMPRRVCRANFWRVSQARAAHEGVLRQQGTGGTSPSAFQAEALSKQQLLAAEMRRLVAEDPELGQAAFRLGSLQQALVQHAPPRIAAAAADGQGIPHDAHVTHAQIGDKPWDQALQWRTFMIVNLSGKLRSAEVRCTGLTERLQWEEGVEWRLPDDWKSCSLRVDARAGTTFALYEFEYE